MIPTSCGYRKVEVYSDDRGKLWKPQPPFEAKNTFFVTNVNGKPRGGHAHRKAHQAIWCVTGSMTIVLDASNREIVQGINPGYVIIIPPRTWVTLTQFKDCNYCVWSSEEYDESEIVRDPNEFYQWYGRFPSAVQTIAGELVVGDAFGAL